MGVGNTVQCWTTGSADDRSEAADPGPDDAPASVTTAEVRGVADDIVTLAVDTADSERLAGSTVRLMTLPRTPRADREFAALLRRSDETMGVTTVTNGSPLAGVPVDAEDVAVLAVKPAAGAIVALPGRDHRLAPGGALYAVDRPPALRALDAAAGDGWGQTG